MLKSRKRIKNAQNLSYFIYKKSYYKITQSFLSNIHSEKIKTNFPTAAVTMSQCQQSSAPNISGHGVLTYNILVWPNLSIKIFFCI